MDHPANLIFKHFPDLCEQARARFLKLESLYREWNAQINVVSRQDIDNLYLHHVLHSLGIAKVVPFPPGSSILDVGTGGGFPGIPLAILHPDCTFKLIDSMAKKVLVTKAVAEALELQNVAVEQRQIAEERGKFTFVVSRGVMSLPRLAKLVKKNLSPKSRNSLSGSLVCLKGGDLTQELAPFGTLVKVYELSTYFPYPFFETKKVVCLPG